MRQEFYKIYQEISDDYERPSHFFPPRYPFIKENYPVRFVRDCIHEALQSMERTIRLRPDGEHFLLTNFTEMFVLPVLHPTNPNPVRPSEIREAIVLDVKALMNEATALKAEQEEVTGEDVLKAAAGIADSLQINRFRFWGAREHGDR